MNSKYDQCSVNATNDPILLTVTFSHQAVSRGDLSGAPILFKDTAGNDTPSHSGNIVKQLIGTNASLKGKTLTLNTSLSHIPNDNPKATGIYSITGCAKPFAPFTLDDKFKSDGSPVNFTIDIDFLG